MPLADILKQPSKRIKLENELNKFKESHSSNGKYECYQCPGHFGRKPRFETHEEYRDHWILKHRSKVTTPIQKKVQVLDPPEVKTRTKLDKPEEFTIWLRLFLSKHPHYQFIRTHRNKFSNFVKQFILLDTRRNVKVVMSESEINQKVKYATNQTDWLA